MQIADTHAHTAKARLHLMPCIAMRPKRPYNMTEFIAKVKQLAVTVDWYRLHHCCPLTNKVVNINRGQTVSHRHTERDR